MAIWLSFLRYSSLICLISSASLIKWYLIDMCFVLCDVLNSLWMQLLIYYQTVESCTLYRDHYENFNMFSILLFYKDLKLFKYSKSFWFFFDKVDSCHSRRGWNICCCGECVIIGSQSPVCVKSRKSFAFHVFPVENGIWCCFLRRHPKMLEVYYKFIGKHLFLLSIFNLAISCLLWPVSYIEHMSPSKWRV